MRPRKSVRIRLTAGGEPERMLLNGDQLHLTRLAMARISRAAAASESHSAA
jgi:hypothetical protein